MALHDLTRRSSRLLKPILEFLQADSVLDLRLLNADGHIRGLVCTMDPFTLKKLAGHESLETTMKYIHLNEGESEERLRQVRDKLADDFAERLKELALTIDDGD